MPSRAFTGVPFGDEMAPLLRRARAAFVDAAPGWAREKWVSDVNLHLTLCFIGPLADERVGEAVSALRGAASRHSCFELSAESVVAKPRPREATMLWLSFGDPEGAAAALAADVADALVPFGVVPDTRRFAPHGTLARARGRRSAPIDALAAADAVLKGGKTSERVLSVRGFTLFSSTLTPTGPLYDEIAFLPLSGVDCEHVFV